MTCFRTDQNGDGCRVKNSITHAQNLFVAPVEIYPPTVVGLPEDEPSVAQPATAVTNKTNNRNFFMIFSGRTLDVSVFARSNPILISVHLLKIEGIAPSECLRYV